MQTNKNKIIIFGILLLCFAFTVVSSNNGSASRSVFNISYYSQNQSEWFRGFAKAVKGDVFVTDTSQSSGTDSDRNEDKYLDTTQLLTKYGLTVQEHTVITQDGYILTLIQIPGTGPTVFLMPGLLGSSDDFVVSGPNKGLAYLLANYTLDVWLGNPRGNKYSRKHVYLNPEQRPFWQFSWHEIGIYDVPRMVDHALMVSGREQLTYIGHGQGTTVFFVLNSERPEYNAKFSLMFSLGTVAYTWHTRSYLLQSLVPLREPEYALLNNIGFYEIFPADRITKFVTSVVCSSSRFSLLTCITVLFNVFGFDYGQIDFENLPVQLSHFPSGSSLRQLIHYLQLAASRTFAQFDFGREENQRVYGTDTPPSYDVEKVTAPIAIFYGDNDWLSSFDDTSILIQRLPNVIDVIRVPHSKFNHFDFIWAKNIDLLVYWKIIDLIREKVCSDAQRCAG